MKMMIVAMLMKMMKMAIHTQQSTFDLAEVARIAQALCCGERFLTAPDGGNDDVGHRHMCGGG